MTPIPLDRAEALPDFYQYLFQTDDDVSVFSIPAALFAEGDRVTGLEGEDAVHHRAQPPVGQQRREALLEAAHDPGLLRGRPGPKRRSDQLQTPLVVWQTEVGPKMDWHSASVLQAPPSGKRWEQVAWPGVYCGASGT